MEKVRKSKRGRNCWTIAKAQARRPNDGRNFLNWLPLVILGVVLAGATGRPNPVIRRAIPDVPEQPRNEYEGGRPSTSKTRGRYKVRPSMHRLLTDVGRRSARDEALAILMSRLPDMDLKAWLITQLDGGDMIRLRLHARPDVPDDMVVEGWRGELANDKRVQDAETADEHVQAKLAKALADLAGHGKSARKLA